MTRSKRSATECPTVQDGYRRLAFGPVGDAVRLAFLEEGESPDYDGLDLFNVSEIRRVKGGVEVRFYDRLAALDRLWQVQREESRRETGFYDALRQGAMALEREASSEEEDRGGERSP